MSILSRLLEAVRPDGVRHHRLPDMPAEFDGLLGNVGLFELVQNYTFSSVLDVGSGAGRHAAIMEGHGKQVTRFDIGRSRAFDAASQRDITILGDFLSYDFGRTFDCVWACHVLEHSLFPHEFLTRIVERCRDGGIIAVTVPPAKANLVGGHVSLWTAGLLLYRMVLAGLDCSSATVLRYGYNITVLVENRRNDLDPDTLAWDYHDIERCRQWLPDQIQPNINGDLVGRLYAGAQFYFRNRRL